MDTARIASLLAPFLPQQKLDERQLRQVSLYLDLLLKWNAKINLTSVREPEEIITRHFGESFFMAAALAKIEPRPAPVLFDLGSGAGFPGLPIKIFSPAWKVVLIESRQKKATFLKEAARIISMDINMLSPPDQSAGVRAGPAAQVFSGRAEDYPAQARRHHLPEAADFVTLRAVERLSDVLPTAEALLQPAGRLALLIGESQLSALRAALPSVEWAPPEHVPLSQSRLLMIGQRRSP